MTIFRKLCLAALVLLAAVAPVWGQHAASPPAAPLRAAADPPFLRGWTFSGSELLGASMWDYFHAPTSNQYQYSYTHSLLLAKAVYSGERFSLHVELAQDSMFGLPLNPTGPGPQGPLGPGSSYYTLRGPAHTVSADLLKHAYLQLKLSGRASLRLGRFAFNDGAELRARDPRLQYLNDNRIDERLIGEHRFSATERSFDGAELALDAAGGRFTAFAARPTLGIFQFAHGVGAFTHELPINLFYGSYARLLPVPGGEQAEFRLFAIGYQDWRTNVLKTDNRPDAVRAADHQPIQIATYGGDFAAVYPVPRLGRGDVVVWGALQTGSWGLLQQHAGAFFGELGFQPRGVPGRPWLSGGVSLGSGDANPNDGVHGTFMPMLPTTLQVARFPFYNQQNIQDFFGSLVLHAGPVLLRGQLDGLRLANPNDLWYSGGGAFQPNGFNFLGRPSGGARSLADVGLLNLTYPVTRRLTVGAFWSHAWGKQVVRQIFPERPQANLYGFSTALSF